MMSKGCLSLSWLCDFSLVRVLLFGVVRSCTGGMIKFTAQWNWIVLIPYENEINLAPRSDAVLCRAHMQRTSQHPTGEYLPLTHQSFNIF